MVKEKNSLSLIFVHLFYALIFLFLSAACFVPFNEMNTGAATIRISLPGARDRLNRPRAIGNPESSSYEVVFSSYNNRTITRIASRGETILVEVSPGFWDIRVYAFTPDDPYVFWAIGAAYDVDVKEGTENHVEIQMYINVIEAIEPYLDLFDKNDVDDEPIHLPVSIQLTEANWLRLLVALESQEKYVDLNLSACFPSYVYYGGGIRRNGDFDVLNTVPEGKSYIVSMTLPIYAENILNDGVQLNHFINLKHFDTGNGLGAIGMNLFLSCSSINSVSIGNSVSIIGESAFSGTGLTEIVIPNNVSVIRANAFYNIDGLTSVTIGADVLLMPPVFPGNLDEAYNDGKRAGIYTRDNTVPEAPWEWSPPDDCLDID